MMNAIDDFVNRFAAAIEHLATRFSSRSKADIDAEAERLLSYMTPAELKAMEGLPRAFGSTASEYIAAINRLSRPTRP